MAERPLTTPVPWAERGEPRAAAVRWREEAQAEGPGPRQGLVWDRVQARGWAPAAPTRIQPERRMDLAAWVPGPALVQARTNRAAPRWDLRQAARRAAGPR